MKILIPHYIPEVLIDQLKQAASGVDILRLEVQVHESIFRKGLRQVASRVLPYTLYKQCEQLYKPKKVHRIFVDGKLLDQALADVKVFFAGWDIEHDTFTAIVELLPDLQWVHTWKAGLDNLNLDILRDKKIALTHSYGVHSQRIAEFALGCILEVSKHISKHISLKQQRRWAQLQSTELNGQSMGILGTGTLGSEIARLAKSFGMKTVGFNRTKMPKEYFDQMAGVDQAKVLFPELDYLVVCLPLTDKTRDLVSLNELMALRKSAYVINLGRSEIINEESLIQALKERKIAGAVLDVFHHEMQLPNHPYYELDNVILTHYSAHSSDQSSQDIFALFLNNLVNYQVKKELKNVVAVESKY